MQDQHMDDTSLKRGQRKVKLGKKMQLVKKGETVLVEDEEVINRFPNRKQRRMIAKKNHFFSKPGREMNAWGRANHTNVNRQTLRKSQNK
jgi:hypothetical protein